LDFKLERAEVMLQLQGGDAAVQYLLDACKECRKAEGIEGEGKWRLQCLLARAYLQQGQKDMAIVVYQVLYWILLKKNDLNATFRNILNT
jgi:hypothetical protein